MAEDGTSPTSHAPSSDAQHGRADARSSWPLVERRASATVPAAGRSTAAIVAELVDRRRSRAVAAGRGPATRPVPLGRARGRRRARRSATSSTILAQRRVLLALVGVRGLHHGPADPVPRRPADPHPRRLRRARPPRRGDAHGQLGLAVLLHPDPEHPARRVRLRAALRLRDRRRERRHHLGPAT